MRREREMTVGPWTVSHRIEFDETYGWQWEAREAIGAWRNDGQRAELIKPTFEE